MGGTIRSAPCLSPAWRLPLSAGRAPQLAPATIGRSGSISTTRESGLSLTGQTVHDYHADTQSIPCLGKRALHLLQDVAGGLGPGAQTCSRRSYDQRPWRSILLVLSSCMRTAGNRPERMEEIMYGAASVGSVL